MQFKTILATVALATSFVAATPYDELTSTFYARNGVLTCHKHNYQIVCNTTHHCVNGVIEHIAGTYAGNAFCTDHRSCWCA